MARHAAVVRAPRPLLTCVIAILSLGLTLCAVAAQDADRAVAEEFDALFGAEIKRASASVDPQDNLQLARSMLDAVSAEGTRPPFVPHLCDAAYELALRTNDGQGFDLAAEALRTLADRVPDRADDANDKLLTLLQRAYLQSRGDERTERGAQLIDALAANAETLASRDMHNEAITQLRRAVAVAAATRSDRRAELTERIDRLRHLQRVQLQIDTARDRLKANPQDKAAAAELVRLLIVERDAPDEARRYTFLADGDTAEMIRLANRDVADLTDAEAMALGDWYQAYANEAAMPAKLTMFVRARDCYRQFLDQHPSKDLQHVKVTLALKQADEQIDKLSGGRGVAAAPVTRRPRRLTGRWPVSRTGLVFAWRDGADRSVTLTTRGEATLLGNKRASLADGAVLVDGYNDKLLESCRKTNQLTIEAVIQPDQTDQSGPARIVSFSIDGGARNFTLGQESHQFNIRIRTTDTGKNGSIRDGNFGKIPGDRSPAHVLVTYAPGRLMAYVNGELVMNRDDVTGDFSNWEPCQFLFGDEFKEPRDWHGTLSHVAIYARAVPPDDAARHFAAVKPTLQALHRQLGK